jgi:hypothetical protein
MGHSLSGKTLVSPLFGLWIKVFLDYVSLQKALRAVIRMHAVPSQVGAWQRGPGLGEWGPEVRMNIIRCGHQRTQPRPAIAALLPHHALHPQNTNERKSKTEGKTEKQDRSKTEMKYALKPHDLTVRDDHLTVRDDHVVRKYPLVIMSYVNTPYCENLT